MILLTIDLLLHATMVCRLPLQAAGGQQVSKGEVRQFPFCEEKVSGNVDTNISSYGNYSYSRAADPQPAGLGDHRYLITFWSRSP